MLEKAKRRWKTSKYESSLQEEVEGHVLHFAIHGRSLIHRNTLIYRLYPRKNS